MLSQSVLDRHGRLIGHARISTEEQGIDPQLDERHAAGCDAVCAEHASGADRARPVPARLLREISPGETLVVVRLDRLARSVRHLLAVIGMTVCGDRRFRVPDDHGDVGNLARPVGHRIARHLSDGGHGVSSENYVWEGAYTPALSSAHASRCCWCAGMAPHQHTGRGRWSASGMNGPEMAGEAPRPPSSHRPPNGPRRAHSQYAILTAH